MKEFTRIRWEEPAEGVGRLMLARAGTLGNSSARNHRASSISVLSMVISPEE